MEDVLNAQNKTLQTQTINNTEEKQHVQPQLWIIRMEMVELILIHRAINWLFDYCDRLTYLPVSGIWFLV